LIIRDKAAHAGFKIVNWYKIVRDKAAHAGFKIVNWYKIVRANVSHAGFKIVRVFDSQRDLVVKLQYYQETR